MMLRITDSVDGAMSAEMRDSENGGAFAEMPGSEKGNMSAEMLGDGGGRTPGEMFSDGNGRTPAAHAVNSGLVSGAIIKENIRRLWPAGLVSFFVYFMFGVIPIILEVSKYDGSEVTTYSFIGFLSTTAFSIIGILCAIIIPVSIFRYLHSQAALSVAHVLPLRRITLYVSHLISGLLLVFVPALINIALVLVISVKYFDTNPAEYILTICVILLFTYAATTIAGMVSGNAPVHVLTALVFNFAWISLFTLAYLHVESMLFGLDISGMMEDTMPFLSPAAYFNGGGYRTIEGIVLYTVISVVIFLIAYLLYRRIKAERAGDSITARPVEWLFIAICTFGGMFLGGVVLGGLYGYNYGGGLSEVDRMTYVSTEAIMGDILGMVIAFIIALMIVRKRVNIFNMDTLRKFGIMAIAAVIFIAFTTFDVAGVKGRVPEASEIASGAMTTGYSTVLSPYFSYDNNGIDEPYVSDYFIPISGEEDVKALSDFHRSIFSDKGYMTDYYDKHANKASVDDAYASENVYGIKIDYRLKNGQTEARKYDLSWYFLRFGSEPYAELMASESVKSYFAIKNFLGYDHLMVPQITYTDPLRTISYGDYKSATPDTDIRSALTKDVLAELAACMDKDYLAMTAEDMRNPGDVLFGFEMKTNKPIGKIYSTYESALSGEGRSMSASSNSDANCRVNYMITGKSVNTIAWMKEKGIYDSIMKTAAELKQQYEEEYRLNHGENEVTLYNDQGEVINVNEDGTVDIGTDGATGVDGDSR